MQLTKQPGPLAVLCMGLMTLQSPMQTVLAAVSGHTAGRILRQTLGLLEYVRNAGMHGSQAHILEGHQPMQARLT